MIESGLIEVKVFRLIYDEESKAPIVLLKEVNGNRMLPIVIGHSEAQSIGFALQGIKLERPMTHDLLKNILIGFGVKLEKIVINKLSESTFYARIILKGQDTFYTIDARPSDSIALALRTGSPIFVAKDVMDESAISPPGGNF